MILLITQYSEEHYTLANVTRIEERRTGRRTLINPFVGDNVEGEGEIDLNLAQVTLLPESSR